MTLPGNDGDGQGGGPIGNAALSYMISVTLILTALIQLLKLCNKDHEAVRMAEHNEISDPSAGRAGPVFDLKKSVR